MAVSTLSSKFKFQSNIRKPASTSPAAKLIVSFSLPHLSNSGFSGFFRASRPHRRRISIVSRFAWRWDDEDITITDSDATFEHGVRLFNRGDYYECHDVLESLWNTAEEPKRCVLHGILQCCVGLYHLLNQNHRGAMVELGEGLTKLRRQRLKEGPFHQFEQDVSAVLEYMYNTQLEHAACIDDFCVTMDGSEKSYKLLGNFAAGQQLYEIQRAENDQLYIFFFPKGLAKQESEDYAIVTPEVKLPVLEATANDLQLLR